jgi:hypothetical protein
MAPDPNAGRRGALLARVGSILSVFAVFMCGWFAMQTTDWKRIVLFTALALGAGILATHFRRLAG